MNLYKLALEIQGGVDSAFGDSISVAQKHLSGLDKEMKAISDGMRIWNRPRFKGCPVSFFVRALRLGLFVNKPGRVPPPISL